MVLTDEGRKRLRKLMVIQEVSQRDLAAAIGLGANSHSYIGRVLRGEVKTMTPDRAVRLAHHFGVGVDDLFVSRSSTDGRQTVAARSRRAAA